MRPLELTLQGFKSYREKCTFNFEGRGLFGIVGPTGSGKSSILDGLIYSLYGKTPRLERETRKLINSQEEEAKLQLVFEMDGVVWQVTRVVRRKGQSQVVLQRSDGSGDQVTGDRNVNEKLPQILGLDFGAFCASVCLSQGQFDRFLSATATERVQILKGVFALDKVDALREGAKGHGRLLNDQIRILQGSLEALPGDLAATIEQTKTGLEAARLRVEQIREALPAVKAAEMEVERSAREEQAISAERIQTLAALRSIPADGEIEELVSREGLATGEVMQAEKELSAAEASAAETEEALKAIEREGKGWDWCSQLDAAIRADSAIRDELAAEKEVAARSRAALDQAGSRLSRLEADHQSSEKAYALARLQLEETEHRHAAHLLRSELKEGFPCPVCEQSVARVPKSTKLPAWEDARARRDETEAKLAAVRLTLEGAMRDQVVAQERVRSAEEKLASYLQKIDESRQLLEQLAGQGNDPVSAVVAARKTLQAVQARSQTATSIRQKAAVALKQASLRRDSAKEQILKLVTVLSSVCGQLGVDADLIEKEGLPQTAKRLNEQAQLKLEQLDARALDLTSAVKGARSTVVAFRVRFGAKANEATEEVLGQAISRVDSLANRTLELARALERRNRAEAEMKELSERKALYDRLSGDLTDAKFTAYLLTEQTRLLCELASAKFQELTGYYTFDFDAQGSITVIDERTGAVRSPQDTLSGGEAFLASLSLALALAETVANRGGRLECFFLDEGFGSLDVEALDRALDGIQTLAEPGRMIGLISHVGGIQSQLEDLIVLERNSDGSTSIVQESGPIAYLPAAI